MYHSSDSVRTFFLTCLVVGICPQVLASVDLELRAPATPVVAGTTFEIGLYAVANPGPTENVGDIRAIISWNNTVLFFDGTNTDGDYDWPQSGFSDNPDGLNDDVSDGLVSYRAISHPSPSVAQATSAGLLVTTLEFTALVATSPGTTTLSILASAGATPTPTRVLDDVPSGTDVTGVLVNDTVEVVSCDGVGDCADGDECTVDSCDAGVCSYTLTYTPGVECCNPGDGIIRNISDDNDCTNDFCDPATGQVTHTNKPIDTLCGEPDDFPCSFQDKCDGQGTCQPNHQTNGAFCNDDGDSCTNDWCQDGECVLKDLDGDGTPCDDGLDFCTPGQDECLAGVCTGMTDPCTGDPTHPFCHETSQDPFFACAECRLGESDCPDSGCVLGACISWACWDIPTDSMCDNDQFCDGIEWCENVSGNGVCRPDPDPNRCIDPDLPHCDEVDDTCEECLTAAHCTNEIACDGVEQCNTSGGSHVCESGTPVQCPPDEDCIGYICEEPGGTCAPTPINEGLQVCDDDDGCTIDDVCVVGACEGAPPTGLGAISLEMRLPVGAPTEYEIDEIVYVDLFATLDPSVKTCVSQGAAPSEGTVCDTDVDCGVGQACVFATSPEMRIIKAVLTYDPAVLRPSPHIFEPCDTCSGCTRACTSDVDCLEDRLGEPDCLCPSTGGPPPCPGTPPETAYCAQKLVGYPDTCPGSPVVPPCSATCPPGQADWAPASFPMGYFDPNGINDPPTDGDAFFEAKVPLWGDLPVVTTTQDLWVAQLEFTAVGLSGGSTMIDFDECAPDAAPNPTLTTVFSAAVLAVTADLTGVSLSVVGSGCLDANCQDGVYCNGEEYCSSPTCTPGEPGCCLSPGNPCDDGDACTDNICFEASQTCQYPPDYPVEVFCCNPGSGGLTVIDDGKPCTDDVCDPDTGNVSHDPLLPGSPCSDGDPCTVDDECDASGNCSGSQVPDCGCDSDADCDDLIDCTLDRCVGAPNGLCERIADDDFCVEDGVYCNGEEICHPTAGCISAGEPCPGCDEFGNPPCPCEAPDLAAAGPRYLAIRPKPSDSTVPVKLLVTSSIDWPCLSKYVGWLTCGGLGGPDAVACRSDADCNECTSTHLPCLTDTDCDFGRCDNGQECSVIDQNCLDQSTCVRFETCDVSGDLCESAPLDTIDINDDGLPDGTLGVLVDDPVLAGEYTPQEWIVVADNRCSKSAAPCTVDGNCPRGECEESGSVCDVFEPNPCFGGYAGLLNETCLSGAVFVSGEGIRPSDWDFTSSTLVPTEYEVQAECSVVIPPVSTIMWRWADTNNDTFVSVSDLHLIILAIQGHYKFSTLLNDDLAGSSACVPQQILSVTDILVAKRAFQGEAFAEIDCATPCE